MTHPETWPKGTVIVCPECENRYTPEEWDAVSVEMPNGERICEDCKDNYKPDYVSTCCGWPRLGETDLCRWCKEHATFEDQYGVEEEE